MAQVFICDHCGLPINKDAEAFGHAEFNASGGGGGSLDYHNTPEQACFYFVFSAVQAVSSNPGAYPNIATPPAPTPDPVPVPAPDPVPVPAPDPVPVPEPVTPLTPTVIAAPAT